MELLSLALEQHFAIIEYKVFTSKKKKKKKVALLIFINWPFLHQRTKRIFLLLIRSF